VRIVGEGRPFRLGSTDLDGQVFIRLREEHRSSSCPNSVQATEFTGHMRAATVTIARLGMCISGEFPQPGRYTSVTAEWPTIQGAMRFRGSSNCAPVGLPPVSLLLVQLLEKWADLAGEIGTRKSCRQLKSTVEI
jgi:hypothetical protein